MEDTLHTVCQHSEEAMDRQGVDRKPQLEPTEEEWVIVLAQIRELEQRAREAAAAGAAVPEEEQGRMRPDQLAELLGGLEMEEPPERDRSRLDEMTPRLAECFKEQPEQ
eukprot:3780089-Rhodomonas_salina.8